MSRRSSSMEAHDNIRKRVCKACDRCRLKKSKCDGASPCSRCKADNAICVFGERKKSQDKVYPKGYVEMLEQQQGQLVAAIREMYSLLQGGQGWPGEPLCEATGGHPLTHDILERLDLLHSSIEHTGTHDRFEDDCQQIQKKLMVRGTSFVPRRGSVSSESEHGRTSIPTSHTVTPTTAAFPFKDPFRSKRGPPTPPTHSPFPGPPQAVSPKYSVKQEPSTTHLSFANTAISDSLLPLLQTRAPWMMGDSMMTDEPADFSKPMYGYNYSQPFMFEPLVVDPSEPPMPDWNGAADWGFDTSVP